LTATSFVGLAAAAAIIPAATPTQELSAVEVEPEVEEPVTEEVTAASIFDEVAGSETQDSLDEDPKSSETSLDELF
jgi:hypothetical protein